jgi:exosortase
VTAHSTTRQPPIGGFLWPHEIVFLILLGAAVHYSSADFRGSWQPLPIIACALAAALPVLIFRCRDEWRQMPNRLSFFLLLAAWVALFQFLGNATLGYRVPPSLFSWLLDAYTAPEADQQQGLWIPFIVLALYWWKRKELVAGKLEAWWPAIFIVGLGLLLHLAGFVAQTTQISVIGFFVGIYGLTGLLWGKHWLKVSFFPYFLFAFCLPVGRQADAITFPLRLLVSSIVAGVAHLGLAPDLIRHGNILTDAQGTFAYEVAPACSGIRSLTALIVLTTIYGFIMFKSPWKRAVMMLSAVPVAILGNVVRLCFTIVVAEMFGQHAGKMVETNFGFVTFAVAIGCIFLIAHWLEKTESKPPSETSSAA